MILTSNLNLNNYYVPDYSYAVGFHTNTCRNYHHYLLESDYVRHRTYGKNLTRPYLVAVNGITSPSSFQRVMGCIFSTNGVIA